MVKSLLALGLALALSFALQDGDAARSARIFKGNYDNENQHRYFVSILRLEAKDHAEHICGGVIIDSRYVLTAAHCVHNVDKTKLLVRSGFGDNPDQPFLEKKIYHKVLKVMYPKDYHSSSCRSHQYDIAVIKVLRKFDLADDRNFQKAYLPEYNSDYESEPATFVGYGAEKFALVPEVDNETANKVVFKYPIQLKYFSTVVMSPEECKNELNVIVTNDNICTQPKNLDGFSCVGDSGSPLLVDGVVIGIRNNHSECIQHQPELFTRVSSQLGFINKVLNLHPYSSGPESLERELSSA